MATSTYNYKRVYVWELPVRLFHWISVLTILVLIITGFIIADPPAINSNAEASESYWFGLVRTIHFVSAYVIIANAFFRLYWAFVGNRFANWKNFFPYTLKGLKNMWYVLKVDVFLMKDKEQKLSNISIGHNSLAAFSYFLLALVFTLQAMTGMALIEGTSSWWFPKMFAFIVPLFGGEIIVRYIHHLLTWIFIAFTVIHVYLVLYHDYVEARGETSAMISGFKFIRSERIDESEDEIIKKTTEQMLWKEEEDE